MANILIPAPFKYAELQDGEATGKLKCLARNFASERKTQLQSILQCGKIVKDASDILESAGRSSKFGKWVATELGCSLRTAERYRNAFEVFGLQLKGDTVSPFIELSAMYALSSMDCPPEALTEARRIANRGERVGKPLALALIKKHTPDGDDGPEPEDADEETLCDAPTPPWETIEPDAEEDETPSDDALDDAEEEHRTQSPPTTAGYSGMDPQTYAPHESSAFVEQRAPVAPQDRANHIAQLRREAETQLGRLIRLAEQLGLYDKLIMEFTRLKTALREAG